MNEDFGFQINKPFYIVSEMPFNRVATMNGGNACCSKEDGIMESS
jgi:hypothetical protein